MNARSLSLALVGVAIMAQAPADVPGYRTTRWGMTIGQILGALPNELDLIDPPKETKDGVFILQAIKGHIKIADVELTLNFMVDKKTRGLCMVTMASDTAGRMNFVDLETALVGKFGKPTNKQETMSLYETVWVFKSTTIQLIQYFNDYGRITVIKYSPTAAFQGSNLL